MSLEVYKTGRRRDQKNIDSTPKSGQKFGLTRLDETSFERWVMVMDMLGHIREMDVHLSIRVIRSFLLKMSSRLGFSPYSEEDDEPEDEESEEVSSSFSSVILRDVVEACC